MIAHVNPAELLKALNKDNDTVHLTATYYHLVLDNKEKINADWQESFEADHVVPVKELIKALNEIPPREDAELEFEYDYEGNPLALSISSPCGDCLTRIELT